jgi:hypothetical protein
LPDRSGGHGTHKFHTSLVACDERDQHVTTGFEDWCADQGVHPETFGAWEAYERTVLVAS